MIATTYDIANLIPSPDSVSYDFLSAALGQLAVVLIAIYIFFKKKEYENIRSLYLDGGVLKAIESAETTLGTFKTNWFRALVMLKSFKTLEHGISDRFFDNYFEPFKPGVLGASSYYNINEILGSEILWNCHQKMYGFVANTDFYFQLDFTERIRIAANKSETHESVVDSSKIISDIESELSVYENTANRYLEYISILNKLKRIISRKKYSFKRLDKFKTDTEIVALINEATAFYDSIKKQPQDLP